MNVMGVFAAVYVAEMGRSIDWYTRLIGRAPDHRPMPTLVQWVNVAGAGVQLFLDADRAGQGVMTLVTPDLDAAGALLAARNIALGDIHRGDFGGVAGLNDPDGNRVTLAEPPRR